MTLEHHLVTGKFPIRVAVGTIVLWIGSSLCADDKPAAAPELPRSVCVTFGIAPPYKGAAVPQLQQAYDAYRQGRAEEARQLLQAALRADKNLPPDTLLLARLYFADGLGERGQRWLDQALRENPISPDCHLLAGQLAAEQGRPLEAIVHFRQVLDVLQANEKKIEPKSLRGAAIYWAFQGLVDVNEKQPDWKAVDTWCQAWLDAADWGEGARQVRQHQARAKLHLGDAAAAEKLARLAYAQRPLVALAFLASKVPDEKLAEELYQRAIAETPNDAAAYQAFAYWLMQQNRVYDAYLQAQKAHQLDPRGETIVTLAGSLAVYCHDDAAAERLLRDALTRKPDDFSASNHLALVLAASPDEAKREQARGLAEVNARQYAESAEAIATLGWVRYHEKRYIDAEDLLGELVLGGQGSSDAAYFLAQVLVACDRAGEAVPLLERALSTPGFFGFKRDAQALLARLKMRE